MAKKNLYKEDSIESLSPLQFTRLRPQVYAGDCTYSTQLLVEIVSNAIDEFRLGHGNQIDVRINKDVITVRDYGQGFIANSYRDDGKTILEAAFSVLNTSGKYHEDGTYEGTSLGSFGIGSKIATYLSHWLKVWTVRDHQMEQVKFKEGVFEERLSGIDNVEPAGTYVEWQPSEEFFTHTEVEIKKIKELFKTITCLCPGLTINLDNNGEKIQYFSKNGLMDLVDDGVKDKEILSRRFNFQYEKDKHKIDMVMTYTSNYNLSIIPYVNTGLTESGPHITLIKTMFTKAFNKFLRDKKWLKEKEDNLTGDDFQEGMYLVFNVTAPGVGYDAQVKSRVTKIDFTPVVGALNEALSMWFVANEKDVKIIADKALLAREAREKAKKAKEAVRNVGEKKHRILNLPTKLVDAWGKDRLECELLIAEGDSAANGLVSARNGETQAIFPIRGKILSVLKAAPDKILANQEIVNIIKALGLEVNPKTGKMIYDEKKLRYGKIIMCCDADADGQAIKNLLLTMFWTLCPELVEAGRIYAAVPPLFRITTRKNEYIYLRDGAALEEYKNQHQGEKFLINRNKGLGEQDPDELEECLLRPDTRNVEQIIVSDSKKTNELFDILMGTAVAPRRDYMLKYAEEANDL